MTFEEIQKRAQAAWAEAAGGERLRVLVGEGTCGRAAGASEVRAAIEAHLNDAAVDAVVCGVGCLGLCYSEPLVDLSRPGAPRILYGGVAPEDVPAVLDDYLQSDSPRPDHALAVMDGAALDGIPRFEDLPMLKGQVRIVLRNCGLIDPESIDHYIARDGYCGLSRALGMEPDEVIEVVRSSGLRGRGGAGFPTGLKWRFCRDAQGDRKYIICNADEGDPGAFMDRSVLESDPHAVLEGIIIAAYAIGAGEGYIYVRAEYPLAIERLERAVTQAEGLGLIGEDILNSGFAFHLKLKKGAGAFVCGEETALLASIEGKRGTPRPRPPFPAQQGLFGRPTNINNVETLANVGAILAKGSDWFARHGTEKSRGTKTFSLAGKIERTGLIEVPLGIALRDVIFEIGGGIPNSKRIKAVQTGGPSGGCIPARMLGLAVDYETLADAGSIMGSGGLVVMDEDTCMVDIARYFIEFTQSESCGKCVPCRLGTRQMLKILDDIAAGQGSPADLGLLEEIGHAVKEGSLCGLGQTAPNPVLTTLRYFRPEYEAHILRKQCPAAVCRRIVGAPCRHTCPAGVDVPRYIRYIGARRYKDALDVVREKIPFPSVCGWVCFHPCEAKCRRALLDDAIAVRALKRFAAVHGARKRRKRPPKPAPTGKRVAVVGSGPAGLTAAYYLAKLGHRVTVFEKDAEPGGTLRTGIPSFRLPREVIDREITEIRKAGVRIRTGSRVASVSKLFKRGYDAVLLAFGAGQGLKMGTPGEDAPQVYDCISFLRKANAGQRVDVGTRVAVIGGGSSAMDTARMARRLGAHEVTVLYRRTRAEMPAASEEVEEAVAEGVRLEFLTLPVEILKSDGALTLKCIRMRLGAPDDSGRPRPLPVEGSEFEVDADSVIMAVSQIPETMDDVGCEVDRRGRVAANDMTLATDRPGLFAAGDAVTGPASVIEAIAAGRGAAVSIDRYLGGEGNIDEVLAPPLGPGAYGPLEDQDERRRSPIPKRPAGERVGDFGEVELTLLEEAALAEAGRCLRCDLEELED
ncbi:MAG: FAD-dependent oxidoreductase [Planctomycetota bacterium]